MSVGSFSGCGSIIPESLQSIHDEKELKKYLKEMQELLQRIMKLLSEIVALAASSNPDPTQIAALIDDLDELTKEMDEVCDQVKASISMGMYDSIKDAVKFAPSMSGILSKLCTDCKNVTSQKVLEAA